MDKWNGWAGKILNIDLTTGKIEKVPIAKDWAAKYIGGRGFGTRVLYDEVGPQVDALSPGSIITIAPGVLSGTLAPASGRCDLVTKSPLTEIFMRSNLGGFFAGEMKWAGYDLIIICGQSEKPVYLWIADDHVELKDASHLWGRDTWVTQRIIRDELGDPNIKTLKIGPAGENQCFSAAVIGDLAKSAGKVGALWGSKKLKAVAIRGSQGVNIAKPRELVQLSRELGEKFKQDPMYQTHVKYGTNFWVGADVIRQIEKYIPGTKSGGFEALYDLYQQNLYDRNLACLGCPLHCSHYYTVKSGKYKGTAGEGVEGNAQIFTAFLRVNDPGFLCYYNNLCNQLGLNLDVPGEAIAWAMQLYQDGIITRNDTDGIELTWGNQEAILKIMQKMASKEGFGEILDAYPLRAGQKLGRGAELYASHNKGNYSHGTGFVSSAQVTLAYAVATRGYDHLHGAPGITTPANHEQITDELLEKLGQERYGDPKIFLEMWAPNPKKALHLFDNENVFCMSDMTGVCKFASNLCFYVSGIDMLDYSRLLTAVTGVEFSVDDVVKAAERESLLERAYNAREGIRRIDDHPYVFWWQLKHGTPHPLYNYELPMSLEDFDLLLDEYYRLRGCDVETGIPTRAKLEELGLKDVADDLKRRGIWL